MSTTLFENSSSRDTSKHHLSFRILFSFSHQWSFALALLKPRPAPPPLTFLHPFHNSHPIYLAASIVIHGFHNHLHYFKYCPNDCILLLRGHCDKHQFLKDACRLLIQHHADLEIWKVYDALHALVAFQILHLEPRAGEIVKEFYMEPGNHGMLWYMIQDAVTLGYVEALPILWCGRVQDPERDMLITLVDQAAQAGRWRIIQTVMELEEMYVDELGLHVVTFTKSLECLDFIMMHPRIAMDTFEFRRKAIGCGSLVPLVWLWERMPLDPDITGQELHAAIKLYESKYLLDLLCHPTVPKPWINAFVKTCLLYTPPAAPEGWVPDERHDIHLVADLIERNLYDPNTHDHRVFKLIPHVSLNDAIPLFHRMAAHPNVHLGLATNLTLEAALTSGNPILATTLLDFPHVDPLTIAHLHSGPIRT
ncbi:hypothetical protein BC829DRAFT_489381 [Chytridium lagenaria]|nr:hypothetical protein BC829DRAFT_489381 [Chytridium lagenaria]